MLPGLLEEFTTAAAYALERKSSRKYENLQKLLPAEVEHAVTSAPGDFYSMLRHIVDFVSGLTDRNAISLYRRIKGMGL
ncbi:MAG TPA: hypothetical protein VD816_17570 [Ohtaekwangia sp.]|nr:hypothetical protein [Ohtaekwangia sp.]